MLAHLAASLVQSVISSVVKGIGRRGVRRAGREDMNKNFPLYPLSNIQITQYFNYEPRFKSIFSTNNLLRIKDGTYVIKLHDKKVKECIGFHYLLVEVQLYASILLKMTIFLKNKIWDKSITHNIFRMQENESIMCGLYCIAFIKYMLAGKIWMAK